MYDNFMQVLGYISLAAIFLVFLSLITEGITGWKFFKLLRPAWKFLIPVVVLFCILSMIKEKKQGYDTIMTLTHPNQNHLPIYAAPSDSAKIIGYTIRYDGVSVGEEKNGWKKIKINNRRLAGWIKSSDLEHDNTYVWQTANNVLRQFFSLATVFDIILSLVLAHFFVFLAGNVWGKRLDDLVSWITAGIAGLITFTRYEITGTVIDIAMMNSTFVSAFYGLGIGLLAGAIEEFFVQRNFSRDGIIELAGGILVFLFMIFYHTLLS
ncbi:MAG TPA: SH3 domain-containing protein [bacterium]|nr:SH3 domain-containing protein [bacterium]